MAWPYSCCCPKWNVAENVWSLFARGESNSTCRVGSFKLRSAYFFPLLNCSVNEHLSSCDTTWDLPTYISFDIHWWKKSNNGIHWCSFYLICWHSCEKIILSLNPSIDSFARHTDIRRMQYMSSKVPYLSEKQWASFCFLAESKYVHLKQYIPQSRVGRRSTQHSSAAR